MPTSAFKIDPAIAAVLSEQSLGKLIKEACEVWKNNTERQFDMYREGFWFFFDDGMLSLKMEHGDRMWQNELEVNDDNGPGVEHHSQRSTRVECPYGMVLVRMIAPESCDFFGEPLEWTFGDTATVRNVKQYYIWELKWVIGSWVRLLDIHVLHADEIVESEKKLRDISRDQIELVINLKIEGDSGPLCVRCGGPCLRIMGDECGMCHRARASP